MVHLHKKHHFSIKRILENLGDTIDIRLCEDVFPIASITLLLIRIVSKNRHLLSLTLKCVSIQNNRSSRPR